MEELETLPYQEPRSTRRWLIEITAKGEVQISCESTLLINSDRHSDHAEMYDPRNIPFWFGHFTSNVICLIPATKRPEAGIKGKSI